MIIFVNTKRIAESLKFSLREKSFRVENLHGGKTQQQRDQVLSKFRTCRSGVLIATDVAARGLDVNDINVVLNFDFPLAIEDYVHRIGRTARGNKEGIAITFFIYKNRVISNNLVKSLSSSLMTSLCVYLQFNHMQHHMGFQMFSAFLFAPLETKYIIISVLSYNEARDRGVH